MKKNRDSDYFRSSGNKKWCPSLFMKWALSLFIAGLFLANSVFGGSNDVAIIRLKSGGKIKGVIKEKTERGLVIDTGFGTVGISNDDIEGIELPTDIEEKDILKREWERRAAGDKRLDEDEQKQKKEEVKQAVLQRIQKAEKLRQESLKKRTKITEIKFKDSSRIIVDTLLNDEFETPLLVDTGATIVSITEEIADKLGIKTKGKEKIDMTMADGSTSKGVLIVLKSVKVGYAEAKNVKAAVILGEREQSDENGLLGMSFLSNFHVKIDTDTNTFTLEKKE